MKNDIDDFGFSFATEDELKDYERKLIDDLQNKTDQKHQSIQEYQDKLKKIKNMINPLLNNLMKDPEKNYIFWPNRSTKIKAFSDQLNALLDDKE